jgi:CheY-like chemotaxis protein
VATVLVVDDQDIVRDVMCQALEYAGFDVLDAGCPHDAIAAAAAHPEIDVLVSDVVMPQMDAFELAERLRAEVPSLRIIFTSGYADATDEGHFLAKPFSPSDLVTKVRCVLDEE